MFVPQSSTVFKTTDNSKLHGCTEWHASSSWEMWGLSSQKDTKYIYNSLAVGLCDLHIQCPTFE